jgi:pilus assembly protein Flp/PilA
MVMQMIFFRLLRSDSGVTAIEYGLISSLVVVAIIAALQTLGTKVATDLFGLTAALVP